MAMAIAKAREGIAAGQSPFGAVIVKARGRRRDPQYRLARHRPDGSRGGQLHPERGEALRPSTFVAARCIPPASPARCALRRSTGRRSTGSSSGRRSPTPPGRASSELHVDARDLAEMGRSPLKVEGGLLREECAAFFEKWKQPASAVPTERVYENRLVRLQLPDLRPARLRRHRLGDRPLYPRVTVLPDRHAGRARYLDRLDRLYFYKYGRPHRPGNPHVAKPGRAENCGVLAIWQPDLLQP